MSGEPINGDRPIHSYPDRRSTRLQGYDYSRAGAYFVTICVEHRLSLFSRIEEGEMVLSPAGEMVATVWGNLERYYPGVSIDAFVVMPNHVHSIVALAGEDWDRSTVPARTSTTMTALSLADVVGRFKSFTMHEYGKGVAGDGWPRYRGRLWQHRFHDHVLRNERDLNARRQYIADNPMNWQLDRDNPDRTR